MDGNLVGINKYLFNHDYHELSEIKSFIKNLSGFIDTISPLKPDFIFTQP
jgi:hypothetical protein